MLLLACLLLGAVSALRAPKVVTTTGMIHSYQISYVAHVLCRYSVNSPRETGDRAVTCNMPTNAYPPNPDRALPVEIVNLDLPATVCILAFRIRSFLIHPIFVL